VKVNMEITFSEEEILDLVRVEVAKLSTAVPGNFEVDFGPGYYHRSIVAEFIPDEPALRYNREVPTQPASEPIMAEKEAGL